METETKEGIPCQVEIVEDAGMLSQRIASDAEMVRSIDRVDDIREQFIETSALSGIDDLVVRTIDRYDADEGA